MARNDHVQLKRKLLTISIFDKRWFHAIHFFPTSHETRYHTHSEVGPDGGYIEPLPVASDGRGCFIAAYTLSLPEK